MNSFGSPGGGQSLLVPTVGKSLNSKGPATRKKEQRNISDILEAENYGLMKLSFFAQISNSCMNLLNQRTIRPHESESIGHVPSPEIGVR
jgi:hypothetical protein